MVNVKPEADKHRRRLSLLEKGIPLTLIAEEENTKRQVIFDWAKRHKYLNYWRAESEARGYYKKGISCKEMIYGRLANLLRRYAEILPH